MNKKRMIMMILFMSILFITSDVFAYKCGTSNLDYVGCGNGSNMVTGIPAFVPKLISFGIALLRVIIPVALIITGTIEMFKSIISGNPDNIAKCRKRVINKYIGALLAFFIISFVTNIVKLVARNNEKSTVADCFNCYLNNKCVDNSYVCNGTAKEGPKETSIKDKDDDSGSRATVCPMFTAEECPVDDEKLECAVVDGECVSTRNQ